MDFGFRILDFGFRILDFGALCSISFCANFGFRILDFGFRISDFGFWISDFGFWILEFEPNFGRYLIYQAVHADPGRRIMMQRKTFRLFDIYLQQIERSSQSFTCFRDVFLRMPSNIQSVYAVDSSSQSCSTSSYHQLPSYTTLLWIIIN